MSFPENLGMIWRDGPRPPYCAGPASCSISFCYLSFNIFQLCRSAEKAINVDTKKKLETFKSKNILIINMKVFNPQSHFFQSIYWTKTEMKWKTKKARKFYFFETTSPSPTTVPFTVPKQLGRELAADMRGCLRFLWITSRVVNWNIAPMLTWTLLTRISINSITRNRRHLLIGSTRISINSNRILIN